MAEGGGLENRCPVMNGTVGSNPTPSAIIFNSPFFPNGSGGLDFAAIEREVSGDFISYSVERWPSRSKALAC